MSSVWLHNRERDGAAPATLRHLVTTDAFLPHSGGSRVYYSELYKNLLALYPDHVTLLTKKVPGWQEFDSRNSHSSFEIRRRFRPLPNWRYLQWPKALPALAHAATTAAVGDYDCLHCGDLFPQALNGVLLRRLFRLPLIVFCHGDEISQIDKRRYQPRVRDFIYRHADALIAANQFACDGLQRIGITPERIHKLTPGINFELFHPRAKDPALIERYGLQGKQVLLTVARLVPRKGHKVVLQSLPSVMKVVPELRYLIAGEGPEKANLQNMVRALGLQEVVSFIGDVPHDHVSDFYNLCDVFIMANRLEAGGDVESFGMVFTEANALGKPVIGGKSGGAAEAVLDGTTGFLVDPESPGQVAEKLLALLQNEPLRKRMGAAALQRVQTEFNWKSRAHSLRQITAELVSRKSGSRAKVQEAPERHSRVSA
jgi:phosphatidyl-myo-inositol dimannoside synthase